MVYGKHKKDCHRLNFEAWIKIDKKRFHVERIENSLKIAERFLKSAKKNIGTNTKWLKFQQELCFLKTIGKGVITVLALH